MERQLPQTVAERNIRSIADPICNSLKSVPEIQRLYVTQEPNSVSVLAIVAEKDFAVERAIYEGQLQIIEAMPDFKLNLRVISLRGRRLSDVVSPIGKLVFHRD